LDDIGKVPIGQRGRDEKNLFIRTTTMREGCWCEKFGDFLAWHWICLGHERKTKRTNANKLNISWSSLAMSPFVRTQLSMLLPLEEYSCSDVAQSEEVSEGDGDKSSLSDEKGCCVVRTIRRCRCRGAIFLGIDIVSCGWKDGSIVTTVLLSSRGGAELARRWWT
jgi:hypothetical protein